MGSLAPWVIHSVDLVFVGELEVAEGPIVENSRQQKTARELQKGELSKESDKICSCAVEGIIPAVFMHVTLQHRPAAWPCAGANM